jgi:NADH-quinone oxidoreductase subunit N
VNHVLAAAARAPEIDYEGLSPLFALVGGCVLVLLAGLLPGRAVQRVVVPLLSVASLGTAIGLTVWIWEPGERRPIVENALAIDALALGATVLFAAAAILAIVLGLRSRAPREAGSGEYHSLLLGSVAGMAVLAGAENLVTLFVGLELLSIPLYVLCGARVRNAASLEAGLKYLVVGSVGSATLLYGLAFVYGATGETDFGAIARALDADVVNDPLLLLGLALALAGLAFKASVAPFHTWTPDVYHGAPTPVTAFMAVATKAAALAIFVRLLEHALLPAVDDWQPAVIALALITIAIGNAGAIAQRSLKRILAWSGVAQAGYMLVGVAVATRLGLQALAFYLAIYLVMNLAAFAVVVARERVSDAGDDLRSFEGIGRTAPSLAWPLTIAMLALAGIPGTAGFVGKFYLIDAAVASGHELLGIAIVIGSMISLVPYLRVIAVMWMSPAEVDLPGPLARRVRAVAGWSPEADARAQPEVVAVAIACAAATIALGIYPDPLFDVARDVGSSLGELR